MTVAELIEKLRKYDETMSVVTSDGYGDYVNADPCVQIASWYNYVTEKRHNCEKVVVL